MFFTEQQPICDQRLMEQVLVALGKYALFLPTLLAGKSS
jgi:hypothetical protein